MITKIPYDECIQEKFEKFWERESLKLKLLIILCMTIFVTMFVLMKISQGIRYDQPLKLMMTDFQIIISIANPNYKI